MNVIPCERVVFRGLMWCGLVSWLLSISTGVLVAEEETLPDLALQPPTIYHDIPERYSRAARGAQGVSAIEVAPEGRLWAAWYAGKSPRGVESSSSYVVLATSEDDGFSWTESLVLVARQFVHTYDPCLWRDPHGKLWLFWAQSAGLQDGRMGVWAITTTQPDAAQPEWTAPRRLLNGVMLNKPTVLHNGDWLFLSGFWRDSTNVPNVTFPAEQIAPYTNEMLIHDLGDERGSNVYLSRDEGATFRLHGQVRMPGTRPDEHMLVERKDGSLWMLIRNIKGIAQSFSHDGGATWTGDSLFLEGRTHASKRFFLRRLKSGALLLVRNNSPTGNRSHLTAFLSDDEGQTWPHHLVLDERESSYPDGAQTADGTLYVIYDHQRYTLNRAGEHGVGSVQMARITEADLRAGRLITPTSRLQQVITQLRPARSSE